MRLAYFYPMGKTMRVEVTGQPPMRIKVVGYTQMDGNNLLLAETPEGKFCSFRMTGEGNLEPDILPDDEESGPEKENKSPSPG